jgi:hypothetical protein
LGICGLNPISSPQNPLPEAIGPMFLDIQKILMPAAIYQECGGENVDKMRKKDPAVGCCAILAQIFGLEDNSPIQMVVPSEPHPLAIRMLLLFLDDNDVQLLVGTIQK